MSGIKIDSEAFLWKEKFGKILFFSKNLRNKNQQNLKKNNVFRASFTKMSLLRE